MVKEEEALNDRILREQTTREKQARKPVTFVPTQLLPGVDDPHPDYVYRWVRGGTGGRRDTLNMSARLREGWVPVSAEEIPGMIQLPDPESRFPGMIEHGGHVLCKISKEISQARKKYYADAARRQVESVDNDFMRENNDRMPLFRERNSVVKNEG